MAGKLSRKLPRYQMGPIEPISSGFVQGKAFRLLKMGWKFRDSTLNNIRLY